jgi:hypothetical protein
MMTETQRKEASKLELFIGGTLLPIGLTGAELLIRNLLGEENPKYLISPLIGASISALTGLLGYMAHATNEPYVGNTFFTISGGSLAGMISAEVLSRYLV